MKRYDTFSEAVDDAATFLKAMTRPGPIVGVGTTGGGLRALHLQLAGIRELSLDPAGLISRAKRDPDAHDALRMAIALQLFMEKQLPREVTEWLVEFLLGRRERPTASPGAPSSLGMEVLIYGAVGFLVEGGLAPTRSDASDPVSACDAVAAALNRLGKKPGSYARVKAIYLKLRKMDDGTGRIPYTFGQ